MSCVTWRFFSQELVFVLNLGTRFINSFKKRRKTGAYNNTDRDFPSSPVVKILSFHCRGHGFDL